MAVVGRPNVGKSTLFNRLVGEDRSVVHDMPGTTRDAVDTLVETEDGPIVFVDTAGMRRRAKIDDAAEYYSFVRALRAIDAADGKDVRLGGGASTIQQYLRAGLIDEMHVSIAPLLLGGGERLFDHLEGDVEGYDRVEFVCSPSVVHARLSRTTT